MYGKDILHKYVVRGWATFNPSDGLTVWHSLRKIITSSNLPLEVSTHVISRSRDPYSHSRSVSHTTRVSEPWGNSSQICLLICQGKFQKIYITDRQTVRQTDLKTGTPYCAFIHTYALVTKVSPGPKLSEPRVSPGPKSSDPSKTMDLPNYYRIFGLLWHQPKRGELMLGPHGDFLLHSKNGE